MSDTRMARSFRIGIDIKDVECTHRAHTEKSRRLCQYDVLCVCVRVCRLDIFSCLPDIYIYFPAFTNRRRVIRWPLLFGNSSFLPHYTLMCTVLVYIYFVYLRDSKLSGFCPNGKSLQSAAFVIDFLVT